MLQRSELKGRKRLQSLPNQLEATSSWLIFYSSYIINPEDIETDVLQDPVVQITFYQVLNELDIVTTQRDEAHKDLYQAAIGRGKQTASPTEELP